MSINAGTVIIGSDVIEKENNGPVIVEKGKLVINKINDLIIKDSFTVNKGCELIIE